MNIPKPSNNWLAIKEIQKPLLNSYIANEIKDNGVNQRGLFKLKKKLKMNPDSHEKYTERLEKESMNNNVLIGFVKRATQYGIDKNDIEVLLKQAMPGLQQIMQMLGEGGSKALQFGGEKILNPAINSIKEIPNIPENYRKFNSNFDTLEQRHDNYQHEPVGNINQFINNLSKARAHVHSQTRAGDAGTERLKRLVQGLGAAGTLGGAAALGTYGAAKAMSSSQPPQQTN